MTESAIPTQLADNDVIHVDNLSVRFAGAERTVDAVKNLSFHVGRGETLAIVGESGSGKSVTSLALMRLVEYGGGRIINGSMTLRRRDSSLVDLSKADSKIMRSVRGADMAMIFQEPMTSLNPVFTAGDQIAESIRLHQQASAAQARAETLRLLEQVRIPEAKSHPYTQALLAAVPRLGSMHDTDLPARFALVSPEQNAAQTSEKAGVKIENHPSTDGGSLILPYRDQAPILSVRNLITRFDLRGGILNRVQRRVHAVEKVSFDLFPGETLALVGESGCGKSTTGRSLLRLVDIQGGQITFDGQDVLALKHQQLQSLRRDIQFVFQDPFASLDPRLTVGYSIMEPLLIHKVCSPAEARERVGQLLDRVGLSREMAQIFQNPQHPYTRKLMSAVPIADPTRRHQKRVLDVDELPSPIRGLNDDPLVAPLVQVGPDHYVARHQIGGVF
eukprot:gene3859-3908_t